MSVSLSKIDEQETPDRRTDEHAQPQLTQTVQLLKGVEKGKRVERRKGGR